MQHLRGALRCTECHHVQKEAHSVRSRNNIERTVSIHRRDFLLGTVAGTVPTICQTSVYPLLQSFGYSQDNNLCILL